MKLRHTFLAASFLTIAACSDDWDSGAPQEPPIESPISISFSFADTATNWDVGFSDYPVENNEIYDLRHEYTQLPEPLQDESGLLVSGKNYSDDLFMYVTSKLNGFQPNTRYVLDFEIVIATDAPSGCFGIGGAQGENVYVKAGATAYMPASENLGTGNFSMNLDKGNQSTSGSNAINIGDLANGRPCNISTEYVVKKLSSESQVFEFITDAEGSLWLMFGTDSGFEGMTSIYYLSGNLTATLVQ